MTNTKIKALLEIKTRFQPFIKNPYLIYVYIAPEREDQYNRFFTLASLVPTLSNSMFEVLSNDSEVIKILSDNFSSDTNIQIYVGWNDAITSIVIKKGTLQDYVKQKKIDFKF